MRFTQMRRVEREQNPVRLAERRERGHRIVLLVAHIANHTPSQGAVRRRRPASRHAHRRRFSLRPSAFPRRDLSQSQRRDLVIGVERQRCFRMRACGGEIVHQLFRLCEPRERSSIGGVEFQRMLIGIRRRERVASQRFQVAQIAPAIYQPARSSAAERAARLRDIAGTAQRDAECIQNVRLPGGGLVGLLQTGPCVDHIALFERDETEDLVCARIAGPIAQHLFGRLLRRAEIAPRQRGLCGLKQRQTHLGYAL